GRASTESRSVVGAATTLAAGGRSFKSLHEGKQRSLRLFRGRRGCSSTAHLVKRQFPRARTGGRGRAEDGRPARPRAAGGGTRRRRRRNGGGRTLDGGRGALRGDRPRRDAAGTRRACS